MTEPQHRVLIGDCRESMRTLPAGSVHCCVTSPPYWALRDYGVEGQLGLEKTPDEYVASMVDVFRDVWRVLRDDGCLWVNIGDSYSGGAGGRGDVGNIIAGTQTRTQEVGNGRILKPVPSGLKPKDLVGIPWRLAFALQADGWYLRQDIIWHKPAPMPESVRDRCTKAHEYIFLLTKKPRYFFDAEAVKERSGHQHLAGKPQKISYHDKSALRMDGDRVVIRTANRNRRSVWTINTEAFRGAHFATFPTRLVEPCILAGTSAAGCCEACGKPWERVVEKQFRGQGHVDNSRAMEIGNRMKLNGQQLLHEHRSRPNAERGWQPTCTCNAPAVPCTVLDPFGGSGTTAGVALYHRRNAILCELNPEYAAMVPDRVDDVIRRMRKRAEKRAARKQLKPLKTQRSLFDD